jgi:hypothetical protein
MKTTLLGMVAMFGVLAAVIVIFVVATSPADAPFSQRS